MTEDEPSLYFYRLRMGGHEQTGIAGCFSVDEYERDIIKKHERTRRDKEDDRTRHIVDAAGADRRRVPDLQSVRRGRSMLAATVTADAPLYDFRADDGVQHTIWKVDAKQSAELRGRFRRQFRRCTLPTATIARPARRAHAPSCASAASAANADIFIAVAFPDDQMHILPYNRTVKDLAGHTPAQFARGAARSGVPVRDGPATPSRQGRSRDVPRRHVVRARSVGGRAGGRLARERRSTWRGCSTHVLEPLLRVGDVRTDKRIDFVGGARGTAALEAAVDTAAAAVAFSMHPVTIDDLMSISDEGGIMPPKSTWFEPKLRDGLLMHYRRCMKVLVADKFEKSGVDGLQGRRLRRGLRAGSQGRRAGAGDRVERRRRARRARHEGDRADAGRRTAVAHRPRRRRLQHDRRGRRLDARHLRLELSRQERDRGGGARVRPDAVARSAHSRQRRGAARRHAGTRRSTRRRRASTAGRWRCSASAASARR